MDNAAAAVRCFPPAVALIVILAGIGLERLIPLEQWFIVPKPVRYSVGIPAVLDDWWILFLTPLCAWPSQQVAILPEAVHRGSEFGEDYLAYKRRTRRWL